MLSWRLLLGVLFAAGLAGLCWADFHAQHPGIWLLPLGLALSVLASGELLWLFASRNLHPLPWPIYAGNAAIFAANYASKFISGGDGLGPFG
ncbi:MAG TPA: hypothetical protein VHB99_08175, partial [Pirellulales bacterium]|nr:hypothetical protein [Pirellulales bacterium]